MASASTLLAALCDRLQTALSANDNAQILSGCKELESPARSLVKERAELLSTSPSAEADEAARPLLHTLQLLLKCAQQTGLQHTVAHEVFRIVRGICTTGDSMQHYLVSAPSSSHGSQLLYAIFHQLLTCSTRWMEHVKAKIATLLVSQLAAEPPRNQSPIYTDLKLCRIYLHPLTVFVRSYPAFFHTQIPPYVLLCVGVLSEILLLPPSNRHRQCSLRDYFYILHSLAVNSLLTALASPALSMDDKWELLDSVFPAFLLGKDEISAEHAAAVLYLLSALLQSVDQLPTDVVRRLFSCQLPLLMALLPRAHPFALLRDEVPPPLESQKKDSPTQQLGKLLDSCSTGVCALLSSMLRSSKRSAPPLPSSQHLSPLSSSTPPSQPDTAALIAVRSFLWRHLLSRQPLVFRLIVTVFVYAVPRWGTTFRVQTLQAALHVLRVGDRPLEELWRMEAVEAVSDILSAIFPLLSESEQQMLWISLGVVEGLTRLAADCDVVIAFDLPPSSSRSINSSQSSSQSLTPTQTLSASPSSSSQPQSQGGRNIPLGLVVRLLCRTHLSALHSSTQSLASHPLIRLLVACAQSFSWAERIGSVEKLSLLLYTFNLLEWLLASPLALSNMLSAVLQRDVLTKVAAVLSSLLRVADPSSSHPTDASHNHAMSVSTVIERLQDCSPLLQQRVLLAVLDLLDTSVVDELTSAQLLRVLQGTTAIAERWPSIRWRLPPVLLRVCGSPALRFPAATHDSASSQLVAAAVQLWHMMLQRTPSMFTSLTDVLCFDSAITRLFDSTTRLASTPFKHEAATMLPVDGKDEVLRLLKEWQVSAQLPQPQAPSDEQWRVLKSQRLIIDEPAVVVPVEQPQRRLDAQDSMDDSSVNLAVMRKGSGDDAASRYLLRLADLMNHNVRSREVVRMLLQARSLMAEDEWRRVKATLRDDEAEWISLFNTVALCQ